MKYPVTIILLLTSLVSCDYSLDPPLRVGTNLWPGYETLYIARESGFINPSQVKLIELPSATEVINAFKLNKIDVAALTLDEVLKLAQTEKEIRIFLIMDVSHGADKILAKSHIQQPADLNNACIAAEKSALGAFMLQKVLEAGRLESKDVFIQSVAVDKHYDFMAKGECDAIVTFEPIATKIKKLGYIEIFSSRQTPGQIVDVLATRESTIEKQGDAIEKLVSAHWQALSELNQQPEKSYEQISNRLNISVGKLGIIFQELKLPNLKENSILLDPQNPHSLSGNLASMSKILLKEKLLHTLPNTDKLLTPRYVNNEKKEANRNL